MPASPYSQRDDPAASSLVVRQTKRRGVALSCAECRRLKLKCSRSFPCSNCVKKGCAAICPEGSLTTGKGNRFVLANTEALHEKITVLANRVRQLEDGLAEAHSHNSHTPHPLLSEELLQIKRPLERERQDVPPVDEKPETEDTIDSLGSLSISNDGRSTFFGQTANSWYLLQNEEGSDEEDSQPSVDSPGPTDDVAWMSYAFPFSPPINKTLEDVRQSIMNRLPQQSEAKELSDLYFRHASWMYNPISEKDYLEIFRHVYDPDAFNEPIPAQNLGLLCMVLAIGTLVDLERPAHSAEAMAFYHLARGAISIDSVLEEQSITAIQALLLMCHFMFLSEISSPRWAIMGMVVKLAQSVGLHRDSGKWKLDPEQTQKRRELFYELLTYDSWQILIGVLGDAPTFQTFHLFDSVFQSLTFGRPPSLSSAHIDNQLPHPTTKNAAGQVEMSFAAWKHRFSAHCLSVVHDEAFGTRNPNYKAIQELDKKVRNWYVPPSLQVPGFGGAKLVSTEVEQPTVQLTMQRYVAFAIKEITLFYMHRGFFAQALEDNPGDPMGSKYSPSVLAAYSSATSFVGLIESLFHQHPQLTERMWFLFTHVFSCAIVLGSIAAKSQMGLSRSALSHLDSAYNLFTRVSDTARAGKILPVLAKLRERAIAAQGSGAPLQSETATRLSFYGPKIKSEVDELSALGGMTRLVSRRSPSLNSPSLSSKTSNHSSPPAVPESQVYPTPPQESSSLNTWQSYTHIQNLNVNINMGPNDYFSNSIPISPEVPQEEMSMLYQMPHMQQQQHQQVHQQHHHHHRLPQDMSMDTSPHSPSYYGNGYGQGYGNGYPVSHLGPRMRTPPTHDFQDSWLNFMAPYKP